MTRNFGRKIWGTTTPMIVSPMFEMHRLDIKPFMACSIHHHQFKHNAFYVLDGSLYIDVYGPAVGQVEHLRIDAMNCYTVRPGVPHRFRTGPGAVLALEMYYTEPLSEDIIRQNVGGPVNIGRSES